MRRRNALAIVVVCQARHRTGPAAPFLPAEDLAEHALATCNKLPSHVDPPESGRPDVIFTRENVGSLAAEIGVFDEQKIEDLLEQITTAAYWHIYGV